MPSSGYPIYKSRGENGKLEVLSKLSLDFNCASYVKILPRRLCKFLSRVRISAHSFEVETGRYCRPPIPRAQRLCKFCNLGVLGDELHAILQCPLTECERKPFLESIGLKDVPRSEQTLLDILNCVDKDKLVKTARFIEIVYDQRNLLVLSIPSRFRADQITRSGRVSRPPDLLQVSH